jgi:hypothetical protein
MSPGCHGERLAVRAERRCGSVGGPEGVVAHTLPFLSVRHEHATARGTDRPRFAPDSAPGTAASTSVSCDAPLPTAGLCDGVDILDPDRLRVELMPAYPCGALTTTMHGKVGAGPPVPQPLDAIGRGRAYAGIAKPE